jgi:hypothetical protein
MPRYRVNVSRIAYSNAQIEVEADDDEEAMRKAEDEAGNHDFPSEHTSKYEAQGCIEITDEEGV